MTRADMEQLIEAVEEGLPSPTNWRSFAALPEGDPDNPNTILAHRAYYGDLNAAVKLVEALLPGWGWLMLDCGTPAALVVRDDDIHEERSTTPARALLLAILKAKLGELP